jgi:hypothetical protein
MLYTGVRIVLMILALGTTRSRTLRSVRCATLTPTYAESVGRTEEQPATLTSVGPAMSSLATRLTSSLDAQSARLTCPQTHAIGLTRLIGVQSGVVCAVGLSSRQEWPSALISASVGGWGVGPHSLHAT